MEPVNEFSLTASRGHGCSESVDQALAIGLSDDRQQRSQLHTHDDYANEQSLVVEDDACPRGHQSAKSSLHRKGI